MSSSSASTKPLNKRKRNLSFVLSSLQGHEVVIELKSDREVRGYLEEVTPSMDVILRQCRLSSVQSVDGSGEEEYMEQHLIAGSTIRFVHLPPNVQVSQVAGSFMKKMEQNERRNAPHKIHESHNSNKRK